MYFLSVHAISWEPAHNLKPKILGQMHEDS